MGGARSWKEKKSITSNTIQQFQKYFASHCRFSNLRICVLPTPVHPFQISSACKQSGIEPKLLGNPLEEYS